MKTKAANQEFKTIWQRPKSAKRAPSSIPRIVRRCLTQYSENRAGRDPKKETMGTKLFQAYPHLSSSDRTDIRARLETIRDQALKDKEYFTSIRPEKTNPDFEAYDTKVPMQTESIKKATSTHQAAVWALAGIENGGALTRRVSNPETATFIKVDTTLEKFKEDPFKGLSPIAFAKALNAQDLNCMKQASGLSDVAPAQDKKLGTTLTRNYNRLCNFVSASVLLAKDSDTAAERIKYFIKVMKELETFKTSSTRKGNHISFLAIGDALNSASIERLSSVHKKLSEKESRFLFRIDGSYKILRQQYLSVPKALRLMPKAALYSPTILSTFLEGAKNNKLEDCIEVIATTALQFKKVLRDTKTVQAEAPESTVSVPKLPPEGFVFPEELLRTDNDQEDYLYHLSRQLQPIRK